MRAPSTWEPCLADPGRGIAFFDGITIESDRITDPRWDRVLPIFQEEQIFSCRMMEPLLKERVAARVLDLGTGSGVFAVRAARLGCRVVAIDVSPRALRYARHNARANGIRVVSSDPAPGEIQFVATRYEDFSSEVPFDIVVISPPYNPTCDGLRPALHADAGPLGQRCFEELLPHVRRLLTANGICLGNQMILLDSSGQFTAIRSLQEQFAGAELHFVRVLGRDILVEEFLRGQYSSYLSPLLRLRPGASDVEEFITSNSRGRSFSLIYYELHCGGAADAPLATREISNDGPIPWTWTDRIRLHRQIIEHTALEDSFPAPALFLELDALPDFPERPAAAAAVSPWPMSVLRYVDLWLAKSRALDPDSGLFEMVLVDTAPWYPTPDGRTGLLQEAALWATPNFEARAGANRFLGAYQDNTARLQAARLGPFLHPHFTGADEPTEWRSIQFTFRELDEPAIPPHRRLLADWAERLSLDLDRVQVPDAELIRSTLGTPVDAVGSASTAYVHSSIADLGVVKEAAADVHELAVLRSRSYSISLAEDLDLLHRVMHVRLDRLARQLGFEGDGPSALVGLPISMASEQVVAHDELLPESYRGGVWVYARCRHPWSPQAEHFLLDLTRLLSTLYESRYADLAARELLELGRGEGTTGARRALAHQLAKVGSRIGQWLVSPDRWEEIRERLGERSSEVAYRIAPVPELFEALGRTLTLWSLTFNPEDLFPESGGEPPSTLDALARKALEFAHARVLVRDCAPRSFGNSDSDLDEVWADLASSRGLLSTSRLAEWTISRSDFLTTSGTPVGGEAGRSSWRQLSGFLRLLVVASENYLRHGDPSLPLKLSIKELASGHLALTATNHEVPIPGGGSSRDHLGSSGHDVAAYVCRAFLAGLDCTEPIILKESGAYALSCSFKKPAWLHRRAS